jgi:hypothetical protein
VRLRRFGPALAGYAPFLLVATVLALLVGLAPSKSPASAPPGFGGAVATPVAAAQDPSQPAGPLATTPGGSAEPATADGAAPAPPAGTEPVAATGGSVPVGLDHREPGPWPWTHSATMPGDRSRCAPGGQVQDATTPTRIPCVPTFEGDNGGATYAGVSDDTITIVYETPHADPAQAAALGAADLSASDEESEDAERAFVEYFNKHFELYGRKIELIRSYADCNLEDPVCQRNEAKKVIERYHPFIVSGQGKAFYEELTKHGVLVQTYSGSFTREWFTSRRPYAWAMYPNLDSLFEITAEYWCKKLDGKPASRAGDPVLQAQPRKIGILIGDDPDMRPAGERLARALSGGLCGSAENAAELYTYTAGAGADAVTAQQTQMPTIVAGLRQAGVTTVVLADYIVPITFTKEAENQTYHPEYLLPGECNMTHDYLARLYTPTQWNNAFGLSCRPRETPLETADYTLAYRDVRGADAPVPRYITFAEFLWLRVIVHQLQWAGPNLHPGTFERGSLDAPQVGGYAPGPNLWPGWSCCNPYVERWQFTPERSQAFADFKEERYSSTDRSEIDGKPGTYSCANDCRRYAPGEITTGEPLS